MSEYRYNGIGVTESELKSYNRAWSRKPHILPRPANDFEFSILSEFVLGKRLSVTWEWGNSYEIREAHEDYFDRKFPFSYQYGVEDFLCRVAFGELVCGGIARSNYGHFRTIGYRDQLRIERWKKSKKLSEGGNYARRQFMRLADQIRDRREQKDGASSSVLVSKRVDAVGGASSFNEEQKR